MVTKILPRNFRIHHGTILALNNLIKGTDPSCKTLEEIIKASADDASKAGVFNNAAQVWNPHSTGTVWLKRWW